MKTICIIPVYNENQTVLKDLVIETKKHVDKVLVVDDGSKSIITDIGCKILRNKQNYGKGYSLRKGFGYAIKNNFDIVITLDGDGEHNPKNIPMFINSVIEEKGLIIGERNRFRSFSRLIINKFGNFWLKLMLGKNIDFSSGYRAIDVSSLKKLNLISNRFEIDLEIVLESYKNKININSIDIKNSDSVRQSKINLLDIITINHFFDKWVISNHKIIQLRGTKKIFLLIFSYISNFISNIFLFTKN